MTETSQQQKLTCELDRKMDEFDRKLKIKLILPQRRTLMCEFDKKYGHIHHVNVHRCNLGHVHRFRSYSFGHLCSVK